MEEQGEKSYQCWLNFPLSLVRGGGLGLCSREFYSPGIHREFTGNLREVRGGFARIDGVFLCSREFDSPGKNTGFLSNVDHKFHTS